MRAKRNLIIGIVCGVLCAACVFAYTCNVKGQVEEARAEALARYGGDQLEVVVAARDIPAGAVISNADVSERMWIADLLPADSVRTVEEAVGQTTSSAILAGEVVSKQRFGGVAVDVQVPSGMTAVSVPAKEVQSVGGAISAGSHVDLYAIGDKSADLLGENLLVLATSASSSSSDSSSWITVAVAPETAQEVVVAAQKLQLYFTLPGGSVEDQSAQGQGEQGQSAQERSGQGQSGKGQPNGDQSGDGQPSEGQAAGR